MALNIAIIGYGKMGKTIESIAEKKGITVKSIIDPLIEIEKKGKIHKDINKESMDGVDVCIDFTHPDAVISNIKKAAALKKNYVVGTTGWYTKEAEVKKIVTDAGTGLIYAHNFSIGVNIFFRVTANTSKLFNRLPQYDIFAYELHHNQKVDSPSGTAVKLGEILLQNIGRKKKIVTERLDRKISPDEFHFGSVRGGTFPGTHIIGFDSEVDTIEIKHTAKGRTGFAEGALTAAQWLNGKKGFYRIDDMLDEIIGGD